MFLFSAVSECQFAHSRNISLLTFIMLSPDVLKQEPLELKPSYTGLENLISKIHKIIDLIRWSYHVVKFDYDGCQILFNEIQHNVQLNSTTEIFCLTASQ